jgi:hypothetical protein
VGSGYLAANPGLPYSGTTVVRVTNYVILQMFYFNNVANPPVQLQMLVVDPDWRFRKGATLKYYTNSVATTFTPDNCDLSF